MEKIYLSIIIPAYNEEKSIGRTLLAIDHYLARQDYTYEILVVNDGSSDQTAKIVKNFENLIKNLRLVDSQPNHGKGYVVRLGMLQAKGQYRLFMDADNAISIEHLENFWPYIKEGFDIVIGSIEVKGAVKKEAYSGFGKIYRNILGKLSKYLIRVLTIWEIHDTQRAFKLFKAEAAKKIFPRQTIMRWGFDIEILVIAKHLGYKIKELPVKWINPPGKVTFASYLKTLIELFKIKWNLVVDRYKLKTQKSKLKTTIQS